MLKPICMCIPMSEIGNNPYLIYKRKKPLRNQSPRRYNMGIFPKNFRKCSSNRCLLNFSQDFSIFMHEYGSSFMGSDRETIRDVYWPAHIFHNVYVVDDIDEGSTGTEWPFSRWVHFVNSGRFYWCNILDCVFTV